MNLLRSTNNLHDKPEAKHWGCTCPSTHKSRRQLEITVVRFHTLNKIVLDVCDCRPASVQLMQSGLFPCAPLHPTLVVDIRVLNFVNNLFVNIAPNYRAWCDSVTGFLRDQGYQMQGQDPLRRRFTNALQWFNSLWHATKQFVDGILSRCREEICQESEGHGYENDFRSSSPPRYPPNSSPASSRSTSPAASVEDYDEDDNDNDARKRFRSGDKSPPPPLKSPSDYLRSRCLLCFGGNYGDRGERLEFDAIVCIDACFTQKHNKTKSARDPVKEHPETVFVPEMIVKEMEDHVDSTRGTNVTQESEEEDGYEPGLR
ncbi:hypothetical protein V5O48_018796, partial [Marasmius crinis-equi]